MGISSTSVPIPRSPGYGTIKQQTSNSAAASTNPPSVEAYAAGAGNFTVAAQTGDLVLICVSTLWAANATVAGTFDIKMVTSGNFYSSGTATALTTGISAGYGDFDTGQGNAIPISLTLPYKVLVGDLSAGVITFAPYIGATAATRNLLASAANLGTYQAINLGPAV
jgi:hypothetical protein